MLKARDKGDKGTASSLSREVGFEMFFVSFAILHEAAHRAIFITNGSQKASVLEGRDEQGAVWEGHAYKRFGYKRLKKGQLTVGGMNKQEVRQYYFTEINRNNGTGMTWSWDNWYNLFAIGMPATSGQNGDPAIKKNKVKPSTGSPQDDKW